MRRFAATHPLLTAALAGAGTGLAAAVLLLHLAAEPARARSRRGGVTRRGLPCAGHGS